MPQAFTARAYTKVASSSPRGTYAAGTHTEGYASYRRAPAMTPEPPPGQRYAGELGSPHGQSVASMALGGSSSGRYMSPRGVRAQAAEDMSAGARGGPRVGAQARLAPQASGLYTIGLHAPRSDAAHRSPWGHADGSFHKGSHNQANAPGAGSFHRSQNAVIVDGVVDQVAPTPELEHFGRSRQLPPPPPPLSSTQVLNSGPHVGGDANAAQEESWQIAQATGAGAMSEKHPPDAEEEARYREYAQLPLSTAAETGAGPAGGGAEEAEKIITDAAAAADYYYESQALGTYQGAHGGLRRTSRPDASTKKSFHHNMIPGPALTNRLWLSGPLPGQPASRRGDDRHPEGFHPRESLRDERCWV